MRAVRYAPIVGVLSSLVLSCALCIGQVNTATVTGTVTDATGGAVPNAKVEATNEATNVTTTAVTNGDGRFALAFVPIGTYSIAVAARGFQTETKQGVPLSAGQMLDVTFALTVGRIQQNVTVSADAVALSYDSVDQHGVVPSLKVHNLPTARQDWTGLLQLEPSVVQAGNGNSGVSLNGLPPASFLLTVDGTNGSSNPELPSVGFYQGFNQINTVNSDAIEQVSITKGITPASVSGMSGNVNIITKGGTNQFHGTVLEFNSLSTYNARNQFLKTNPRSTFNQFGGSLGGPILHNRLFFFLNYQGVRQSSFTALNGTVPTPLFASQAIAAQPQYAPIFAVFPAPNQPYSATALTAQWIGARSLIQDDNNAVARIDWYLNSSNWLTLRYTDSHPTKLAPSVIAENARLSTGLSDSYNVQFTHVASGWTAATRAAYIRPDLMRLDEGYTVGLDGLSINGINSGGGAENFQIRGGTFEAGENISMTRGKHTVEFGGLVQRLNDSRLDDATSVFTYSNTADFLNNIPNQVQVNFPLSAYQLHMYQFGLFLQDNYRITPNLTINMGLRYDYWTVPKERDGRLYNRNAGPLGVGTGPFRPAGSVYESYWPNFGPRLGLAWSVGSDRKTVIRTGGGMFFNPHTMYAAVVDDVLDAPNVPFRLTLSRSQALAQGLRFPVNKAALLSQIEATGSGVSPTSINAHFPNPYSMQWYFGIQRQLPFGMMLDTAYVGNRAVHLSMTRTANLPNRVTGTVPAPQFGSFKYYDDSDASWYDSWQTSLSKAFSNGLNFGASFTWAHNLSYGAADLALNTVPQDFDNIRADKGPTPYDIQKSFRANFVYIPQVLKWTGWNSRGAKLLVGGWQFSSIIVANTGFPVTVTNNNSANPVDRPDIALGGDPIFSNYTSTLRYFNPAAFVTVPIVTLSGEQVRGGNLGRNALRAPGMWNVDFSIAKDFAATERLKLQLRGDAFNALNHTNLSGLTTNITSSAFGYLTTATARTVQIGAKIIF